MELKGIIKNGESKSLTCCESILDLLVNDISLYEELEKEFAQDSEDYFNAPYDNPKTSPVYSVRYVILDEQPSEDKTFEQQTAETVMNMLYASFTGGCYSEWTCGFGGFDYMLGNGDNGHSIFEELKDSIGKYIHIQVQPQLLTNGSK